MADITKAFLQIRVRREDQDVHRFLWKEGSSVRIMRFVRVPFGNKSSPFLLNATIKHHMKLYPCSEVARELDENLYVDDWLSGADSTFEASVKLNEACALMKEAGMSLSKWSSNSKNLIDKFGETFTQYGENESVKILGMQWFSSQDCFSFNEVNAGSLIELVPTKRAVLSLIARCFDPLGFVSPFIMVAKILFQDVWRLGLKWDEVLPEELQNKFQKWFQGFERLSSWKIQWCYFQNLSWNNMTVIELHAFGDASEKRYGACVYLRIPLQDGSYNVSFIVGRGKVAPIKRVSLPWLELLGALLCARLLEFVRSALHFGSEVVYYCWTGSTVALSWIKGDPKQWKVFVANRVVEIQSVTSPDCWHHCPGKDNPADLISRGAFAEQLVASSSWLVGPPWLHKYLTFQPEQMQLSLDEIYDENVTCVSVDPSLQVFEFSRYSSFQKVLNAVAWVMRFINNVKCQSVKCSGPLSYEELTKAKVKVFCCVQREEYPQ